MRLTRTHLGLLAALALVLTAGAAGFVLGTGSQPVQASSTAAAGAIDAADFDAAMAAAGFALDPSTGAATASGAPSANAAGPAAALRALLGRQVALARAARVLVHLQVTADLPQRGLQTYALDHGTVSQMASGQLMVKEADGTTVTVAIDTTTRVRSGGAASTVAAIADGANVIVVSQQVTGGWHALAVVIMPAAGASASPSPSD